MLQFRPRVLITSCNGSRRFCVISFTSALFSSLLRTGGRPDLGKFSVFPVFLYLLIKRRIVVGSRPIFLAICEGLKFSIYANIFPLSWGDNSVRPDVIFLHYSLFIKS